MARRKSKTLFAADAATAEQPVEQPAEQLAEIKAAEQHDPMADMNPDRLPKNIAQDVKERLEHVEELEKANAQLFQEKSDMVDTVARYLDEIESLKKSCEEKDSQIDELRKQVSSLREETDDLLLTISRLSFENSSLQNKASEVSATVKNADQNLPPQYNTKNVLYKSNGRKRRNFPNNGYSSWN